MSERVRRAPRGDTRNDFMCDIRETHRIKPPDRAEDVTQLELSVRHGNVRNDYIDRTVRASAVE